MLQLASIFIFVVSNYVLKDFDVNASDFIVMRSLFTLVFSLAYLGVRVKCRGQSGLNLLTTRQKVTRDNLIDL